MNIWAFERGFTEVDLVEEPGLDEDCIGFEGGGEVNLAFEGGVGEGSAGVEGGGGEGSLAFEGGFGEDSHVELSIVELSFSLDHPYIKGGVPPPSSPRLIHLKMY